MRALGGAALIVVAFAGSVGCGGATRSSADESASTASTASTASGGSGGSGGSTGSAGLPDAWQACADSTECVATFAGCCDHCTQASPDNSVAIHRSSVAAYRDDVCPHETICPRCVSIPNPNLHAVCTEGRCTLVDISLTPIVTCTESSDCKLRATACCECELSASWIAINTEAETEYASLVCAPDTNCPECTVEVTDIDPACDAGRCVVRTFGR